MVETTEKQIEEFYNRVIDKANEHARNKEFDKAIAMIEDELQAPYIPQKYIDIFERLYVDLEAQKRFHEVLSKYKDLSREEVLIKIFNNKKFNPSAFDYYISKYKDDLNAKDYMYFQEIFLSPNISIFDKCFCLNHLKLAEVDHSFTFNNHKINQKFLISPIKTLLPNEGKEIKEIENILIEDLQKDPSILKLAQQILNAIAEYHYGDELPHQVDDIVRIICGYINRLFSNYDDGMISNEEFKWINDILGSEE